MINGPDLVKIEAPRPSRVELDRIKSISDSNMTIISKSFIENNSDENKRNIIVQLISALDYYIHDIIIWGIIEITENEFPKGQKYDTFKISIKYIKEALTNFNEINKENLKEDIIKILSYETYQKWENIRKALKIILPKKIDNQIGLLTQNKPILKFETELLESLNNSRNSIVHTFDRNLHNEAQRNKITIDIREAIKYIDTIINSIHDVLIKYDSNYPENNDIKEEN